MFGVEPVIAMVSYSFVFYQSKSIKSKREAAAHLHEHHPDLIIDGEVQADFALNPEMLKENSFKIQEVNNFNFPT
jgi:malate dehydrogenase (oxaloacetate-decarboxylating)(NADP+)